MGVLCHAMLCEGSPRAARACVGAGQCVGLEHGAVVAQPPGGGQGPLAQALPQLLSPQRLLLLLEPPLLPLASLPLLASQSLRRGWEKGWEGGGDHRGVMGHRVSHRVMLVTMMVVMTVTMACYVIWRDE